MLDVDKEFSALNRAATVAKAAGDMGLAVDLLRKAKALLGPMYAETRLAKYLAAAGDLDGALAEIQWLLDGSASYEKQACAGQPLTVMLRQKTNRCALIHRDAAAICRRAKRPDLQDMHQDRFESLLELLDKIEPVAEADENARSVARAHARSLRRSGVLTT
jgi:hypothetical protein